MANLADVIAEARRRRVFRGAGLYIVGAWVLIQVASLVLESLELPAGLLRYFWLFALAGFPVALVLSWYYEISPKGIRKTTSGEDVAAEDLKLKIPDYVIIAALAIVAGVFTAGVLDRLRGDESLLAGLNGIAVLPLDNLSGDESQEYFSAGMHDALITSLSKISALRVVSRTSTVRLDRALSMPQIADVLGVGHVIEGSVAREGNRVRIIVQLIDAANDAHVWAESFERELSSVLSLQNEMALAIAQAINIQLSESEQLVFAQKRLIDPDTYDAYLRGMYLVNQTDNTVRRRGIKILEGVVAKDSRSALAYAGLAYGYAILGHGPYPDGMYPASKLASARALELDDSLAEAHLSVAMLKMYYEWDFEAAEVSFRRAAELNPSLAAVSYHHSWLTEIFRRSDLTLPLAERAVELDPLSPGPRQFVGSQYRAAGLYEKALQVADDVLELDPENVFPYRLKGMIYADLGEYDKALEFGRVIRDDPIWGFGYGVILAQVGRLAEAREVLDAIDKTPRNVVPLLRLYGAIGDKDEFFRWLVVARDERIPFYPWFITWYPMADEIRKDPRMKEFAAEIGLLEVLEEINRG